MSGARRTNKQKSFETSSTDHVDTPPGAGHSCAGQTTLAARWTWGKDVP